METQQRNSLSYFLLVSSYFHYTWLILSIFSQNVIQAPWSTFPGGGEQIFYHCIIAFNISKWHLKMSRGCKFVFVCVSHTHTHVQMSKPQIFKFFKNYSIFFKKYYCEVSVTWIKVKQLILHWQFRNMVHLVMNHVCFFEFFNQCCISSPVSRRRRREHTQQNLENLTSGLYL